MSETPRSTEMLRTAEADVAAERAKQTRQFVVTSPDYYVDAFQRIGSDSRFVWTFNLWSASPGPRARVVSAATG